MRFCIDDAGFAGWMTKGNGDGVKTVVRSIDPPLSLPALVALGALKQVNHRTCLADIGLNSCIVVHPTTGVRHIKQSPDHVHFEF